jgi:hypothetical protein
LWPRILHVAGSALRLISGAGNRYLLAAREIDEIRDRRSERRPSVNFARVATLYSSSIRAPRDEAR